MGKKEVTLKEMLNDLVKMAEFCPGKNQNMDLSRGLRISIKKNENIFNVGISRGNIQPSMQEWNTIRKHLLFGKGKEIPTIYKINGRVYLVANLEK